MPVTHDAFISYSREDEAWANEVFKALEDRGLRVFMDTRRVLAGRPFERDILDALQKARHLVVLWSPVAKESDWVNREIARFELLQNEDPDRRLILVTLKAANRAFGSIQAVNELTTLYPGDPSAVDATIWRSAMKRIEEAIRPQADLSIPVVVLTMTKRDQLLDEDWAEIEAALGTPRDTLMRRYGETRPQWKPAGDSVTVADLLDDLRRDIEKATRGRRLEWDQPDDSFWNPGPAPADYVSRFLNAPASLLVIDPIALKRTIVIQRLNAFQTCLESAKTAIAVLPPYPLPPQYGNLRSWIRSGASPYFDAYFDPPIPPTRNLVAQCAFGGADEVRRSLLVAIGRSVTAPKPAAGFLDQ